VSALDLDTPLIASLREHLLRLARASFEPVHGGRRAQEGSPEEDAVMDRFRPFAELFLLIAAADGKVDDAEKAAILGSFRALTGGRVRSATLLALEEDVTRRVREGDQLDMLEGVCARLAADARDADLAYTLASAVAFADRRVDAREAELLETLADWLRISPARRVELTAGRPTSDR
jgi:tellurite resistance protein